VTRKRENQ